MSPDEPDHLSDTQHDHPAPADEDADRDSPHDDAVAILRRAFVYMAWRDAPVIRLRYDPANDVLTARFLPLPGVRRQYPHNRLCVAFGDDAPGALPTAVAISGFLDGSKSPADATLRTLLGPSVWRRAVELAVSGDRKRKIRLDRTEGDSRLAAWQDYARRPRWALGVEVVPGQVRAVLVDDRGEVRERRTHRLKITSPRSVAEAVGRIADELRRALGQDLVIGIEIGGPVDRETGVVYAYNKGDDPTPLGWVNAPLGDLVSERCGAPTMVLNDVEALATHEVWFGLGTDVERYGVLLVGEGIGGALVVRGRVDTDMPMELGNIVIHPDGRKCRCGNKGCVEASAGTWAIVEQVQQGVDHEVETMADAVALAERNDDDRSTSVEGVFHTAGQDLGVGIGSVQAIANPQAWAIYLPPELETGAVAKERFVSGLKDFEDFVSYEPYRNCRIQPRSTTGEEGARGAALAALEEFEISSPRGARRSTPSDPR